MIRVTKFNGKSILINPDWIQSIEATPDTVITLTNGYKFLVKESPEVVADRFEQFKERHPALPRTPKPLDGEKMP